MSFPSSVIDSTNQPLVSTARAMYRPPGPMVENWPFAPASLEDANTCVASTEGFSSVSEPRLGGSVAGGVTPELN